MALNPSSEFNVLSPHEVSLIAFDLDSTLIRAEGIDELARAHGVYAEVAKITEEAMQGSLPFPESFRRRLELLKGLTEPEVASVMSRIQITDGAAELISNLKTRNFKIAILSGGFSFIGNHVAEKLGIDVVVANHLDLKDGFVTGIAIPPIIDGEAKAENLRRLMKKYGIPRDRTFAVGDGANDLPMIRAAGMSFSFNGKPLLRAETTFSIEGESLLPVLKYLPI